MSEPRLPGRAGAPVCIAGMHRSGTSAVAQLLYQCGLYLGREGELLPPSPDNQDGYWENARFVEINEQILKAYRSGWDLPPSVTVGWHEPERLSGCREQAERLLREFEGQEPWGWKDPRNSLTLPFWTTLLPGIKVVVCLRNPLEVALSLRKRNGSSFEFGLKLWTDYNEQLLDALATDQYIVTHYEAYFSRPMAELRRVLDFLRLPASDQLIAQARSSALRGLRRNRFTTRELLEADVSPRVVEMYLKLCEQANWRCGHPSDPDGGERVAGGLLA